MEVSEMPLFLPDKKLHQQTILCFGLLHHEPATHDAKHLFASEAVSIGMGCIIYKRKSTCLQYHLISNQPLGYCSHSVF